MTDTDHNLVVKVELGLHCDWILLLLHNTTVSASANERNVRGRELAKDKSHFDNVINSK